MSAVKSAREYRDEAARATESRLRSERDSDTDGFLSQWASGLTARLADRKAEIVENGMRDTFTGLYDGDRRVLAKLIDGQFGEVWLLHESERGRYDGRVFVPYCGGCKTSRVQKRYGLSERRELAPAWAKVEGRGTGLSGSAWVTSFRTGDPWGSDAELDKGGAR